MKKLGQTATEYMVVLAVVIIISLIVAAILGQFPGLGSSARVRGSSAFWSSSDIGVNRITVTYDDGGPDDVILTIRNNNNEYMRIQNVIMKPSDEAAPVSEGDIGYRDVTIVLAPGEEETLRLSGMGYFCSRAGDPFSVSLTIKYKEDFTGEEFVFSGRGNYLEGRCAG